jgi:hypothetical protein
MNQREIRVSLLRWMLGIGVIAAWTMAMVLVARQVGTASGAVAGVLFTVPLCSLGEWLVHGFLYHRGIPGLTFIRAIHHSGHHSALFPPRRYVHAGPFAFMRFRKPYIPFQMADNRLDNDLTMYSQVALHFVVGIPLILWPAWKLGQNNAFLVSVAATLVVISWLLAYVHGVIHTPRNRWIERRWAFQWLNHHHYIHHIDMTANINFMLPICDFLLGTQKDQLTADEKGAFPRFEEAMRVSPSA